MRLRDLVKKGLVYRVETPYQLVEKDDLVIKQPDGQYECVNKPIGGYIPQENLKPFSNKELKEWAWLNFDLINKEYK